MTATDLRVLICVGNKSPAPKKLSVSDPLRYYKGKATQTAAKNLWRRNKTTKPFCCKGGEANKICFLVRGMKLGERIYSWCGHFPTSISGTYIRDKRSLSWHSMSTKNQCYLKIKYGCHAFARLLAERFKDGGQLRKPGSSSCYRVARRESRQDHGDLPQSVACTEQWRAFRPTLRVARVRHS